MALNFDFRRRLGAGFFGEVWLAIETGLQATYAVKLIHPSRVLNPANLFLEAQVLKAVEHPNVVQVVETGQLGDQRIYIAMEFLQRGSVDDESGGAGLSLSRSRQLMIDVLRGLHHAHDRGIVHRDVKPANIMVGADGSGKLSDFGLAVPGRLDPRALGQKDYVYALHLAPEVRAGGRYSVRSDIFACGMTLYRMINGDYRLGQFSFDELRDRLDAGQFPEQDDYRSFVPRPLRIVVNKALSSDPAGRYSSAEEMRHALERVALVMDMSEIEIPGGYRWAGASRTMHHQVELAIGPGGKWKLQVLRGRDATKLRQDRSRCVEGLTKSEGVQKARRLLQDLVLGKVT